MSPAQHSRPATPRWIDDGDQNRLDDHLEEFGDRGDTLLVDFLLAFDPDSWRGDRTTIVQDLEQILDAHPGDSGPATIHYLYDVVPAIAINDAELSYPLWIEGDGYLDPLFADLLGEESPLPITMVEAIHRFLPATTDYLVADHVVPDFWTPAPIPGPAAGQPALVAVVDTGVEDLGIDSWLYAGGYDAFADTAGNPGDLSATTGLYHGTRVAYAATGLAFSNADLFGVAPLSGVLDIRIAENSTDFGSTTATVLKALDWIWVNRNTTFQANYGQLFPRIDAVNFSYADMGPVAHRFVPGSGNGCSTVAPSDGQDQVSLAADTLALYADIPVIAAAGNCGDQGQSGFGQLAAASQVIAVAAYDMLDPANAADDTIFAWSSHGPGPQTTPKPDLAAPGAVLFDTGTSFSAPQVAGTVALLREQQPQATAAEVRTSLIQSAVSPSGAPGTHDDHWGWGRLQAAAAADSLAVIRGGGG